MEQNIQDCVDEMVSISNLAKYIKQADKELRARMGFGIGSVIDEFLTIDVYARPIIDIVALDKRLHRTHGNYEEQGLSMAQVLHDNYGEDTLGFINNLLP